MSRSKATPKSRGTIPSVVVVDPRFDAYAPLAAAAREGRLHLHLRSSGGDALRLARRRRVDAWIVAENLDDMAGHDFVTLLQGLDAGRTAGRVAMVAPHSGEAGRDLAAAGEALAAGADALLTPPISLADLADFLALPADQQRASMRLTGARRGFVTLPIGIGAAVIAVAIFMMG